ncbi:hypothetical protein HLB23_20170 [Nocardia uniformis]|uniref:Uncharacterized protein n=1 Tax=Nocardia uniformis TaxID=53432 RepID=A0A849C8D4_9NOCA|nr:hypothetical protein [Nocardia uniformis]NNH72147.1 hypothetical protein [Nocardia uniformis]
MTSTLRRTTRCVIAIAATGCLGAAGIAHATGGVQLVAAENLVANPTFAEGVRGWEAHLHNADVNGGNAVVHDNGYVGQDVPVTKGSEYTVSMRVGAAPGGGVLALALDSVTSVAYLSRTVTDPAPTTVTQTFTATGDTVYLACQATSTPGGWCGDFSVVATGNTGGGTGSAGSSSGSSGSASGSSGSAG